MHRVSIELQKHEWKFGRTRNAVGTRAVSECFRNFFEFSQTFTSVSKLDRNTENMFSIPVFQKTSRRRKGKQHVNVDNQKNYNFFDCDWFKKFLFSTNSLSKLLCDSLLLDTLLSDSSISQSHSKLQFKLTNHIQSCNLRACVRALACLCLFGA